MRFLLPIAALAALFAWWTFAHRGPAPLVVYCAHDSIYSEKILRDFEKRTGIPVAIRFDTEATKSLGLVELLVQEKDAPRCDVFWNNELLGTMDLAERGILEPYKGAGWQGIPEKFRDADGHWTGFAARMRVFIFNPNKLTADQIAAMLDGDLERVAIAKPLYGTTFTHYCALWKMLGADGLKAWHRDTRARGLVELNGNAAVKDAVARGACDLGFTDTDDFFEAKDDGKPVAFVPVTLPAPDGKPQISRIDADSPTAILPSENPRQSAVIQIPNTVAIIRGTKREGDARKLVDFLLSEETELALARSKSRQIPLGPVPADQLPAEVSELALWAINSVDLTKLGPAREECLAWLKSEYLK